MGRIIRRSDCADGGVVLSDEIDAGEDVIAELSRFSGPPTVPVG